MSEKGSASRNSNGNAGTEEQGKPVGLKLRRVAGFRGAASAGALAKRGLAPEWAVIGEGPRYFPARARREARAKSSRQARDPRPSAPRPSNVNTALGNIKAAIAGTHRAINSKHGPRYLAGFECRFSRRYDLAAMIPRLTWAGVRPPPMPYRLLKLAEAHA